MNQREIFLRHVAQTSTSPIAFEISKAEGCSLFDINGKEYLDLIGGISVANTGHRQPQVIEAIKKQLDQYLHVMVYGEFIESPQVQFAQLLTSHLPSSLNSVYFTNSGTEAVEGAMKLSKRATNRTQIIAFRNSYHGSTQGSLSIIGDEYWRNSFRPLLPGIVHLDFGSTEAIDRITHETACIVLEPVQAEAGIRVTTKEWLQAVRKKCDETGCLLVLDEIQSGFGRTGKLWCFEHFKFVPDILLLGKALGGGMPLGAFIADRNLMKHLTADPVLGHITTFGGHPVCCAAGMASMKFLVDHTPAGDVKRKEELFRSLINQQAIRSIRSFGLWMAIDLGSFETNKRMIDHCFENGILTDWFLFEPGCMRVSPPLVISDQQIRYATDVINKFKL